MARDDDWDELAGRPRKGRKPKKSANIAARLSALTTSTIARNKTNSFVASTTVKGVMSG